MKAMSLGKGVRLVGMSVLPLDLSPPESTSSQESDDEFPEEDTAAASDSSTSNGSDPADASLIPCLLLVTQNVRVLCSSRVAMLVIQNLADKDMMWGQ